MNWFNVDKSGLAAILERKGKTFVLFELVSNAWDSGATRVDISTTPVPGEPFVMLTVEDNSPEGWADMRDAFTMFAASRRAASADKRGRFGLGEKLVLACSRSARIETMSGTVIFDDAGRHNSNACRSLGTKFTAEVRMTRDELAEMLASALDMLPPCPTFLSGTPLPGGSVIKRFECKLPTEVADADGALRKTTRTATVEAYPGDFGAGVSWICELGVPVCKTELPWTLNVLQKIPLGMDRDSVTTAFRRALQVAAMNELADTLNPETAAATWITDAISDGRATAPAVAAVIGQRFGPRAVVAVPGDPIANASAEANGCTVIHGGALPADAWANVRKFATVPTTSQAFPSPKPTARDADSAAPSVCPLCKQPVA